MYTLIKLPTTVGTIINLDFIRNVDKSGAESLKVYFQNNSNITLSFSSGEIRDQAFEYLLINNTVFSHLEG